MNKHSAIVILASIVIVASIGYSMFNVTTLDKLQFKWNERSSFDYLTMLNGGVVEVCNTSLIPLKFNGLNFVTFYEDQEVGRFFVEGSTIQPNSKSELKGKGEMTSLAGQMVSMYMDSEYLGGDFARIDSSSMVVFTVVDTTVLGVIPYSVTNQYSGEEFFHIMNGNTGDYSC